jgi:hypothetical protein
MLDCGSERYMALRRSEDAKVTVQETVTANEHIVLAGYDSVELALRVQSLASWNKRAADWISIVFRVKNQSLSRIFNSLNYLFISPAQAPGQASNISFETAAVIDSSSYVSPQAPSP